LGSTKPIHLRYNEVIEKQKQKVQRMKEEVEEERIRRDPEDYGAATHRPQLCKESIKMA